MDPFLLLLLVVLATFVFYGARRRHRPPLPPGPRGLPLIGNLFDRPTRDVWLTYADWAFKYDSNLLSITVLGQPVIILNSIKAVVELFEERSTNYSDRPCSCILPSPDIVSLNSQNSFLHVEAVDGMEVGHWFYAIFRRMEVRS